MQKILVVSDSFDSSEEVKKVIEAQLPYQVFSAYNLAGVQNQLESKVFNLAIIDQAVTGGEAVTIVEYLKASGYAFPVLIITDQIQPEHHGKLNLLLDIHLLVRPVVEKNILGLVRKLLQARRVPKQNYRRFNTNQIAQVEALSSGDSLLTSMYNLSKGGAYCEFDLQTPMGIGDLFKLKVFLSDTNSEYTFNAKVVWTTPKGRFSGRYGCGFKFVSAKDTYRSQLSKA